MAKRFKWDGIFLAKPKHLPVESGVVAPTDKKTEKLRAHSHKKAKPKHKKQG